MNANVATFRALNNAGEGFDPEGEMDEWTLVSAAETTDDVSVYTDEDGATVLVGTDGSGSSHSRWAVRVCGNTITDSQIRALRVEAREAGDIVQVVVCDVALADPWRLDPDSLDEDGLPDYSGGGHTRAELQSIRRWLRSTQDDARAECARVIAAGQE